MRKIKVCAVKFWLKISWQRFYFHASLYDNFYESDAKCRFLNFNSCWNKASQNVEKKETNRKYWMNKKNIIHWEILLTHRKCKSLLMLLFFISFRMYTMWGRYFNREKSWLWDFDTFTRFEVSGIRFCYFRGDICMYVCMWVNTTASKGCIRLSSNLVCILLVTVERPV